MPRPRMLVAGAAAVALAAGATWLLPREPTPVDVAVPELSTTARAGALAFRRHCVECHGEHGRGSANGPPLVHRLYHPGHHADAAFHLAVRRGVRAHHWRFGDMPPQDDVTPMEVSQITRYVRELQKATSAD